MLRDLVPLGLLCLLMVFPPEGVDADDLSQPKVAIEQKVIPNRIFPPGIAAFCTDVLNRMRQLLIFFVGHNQFVSIWG